MVSILMPVKNASLYLKECLESILQQTYKNWELIAINDHSTDASLEILNEYKCMDKRIQVYSNEKKGIIEALILAYSKSSGDYITRMDADDIMVTSKIEKLLGILKKQPNVIATAKVKYFSEKKLGEGYKKYEVWLNQLIDKQSHYQHIYTECTLPSPCWMMTRASMDTIGGFKNLIYPEDYDLCFKAYKNKINIVGSIHCLHHWRDYKDRSSRNDPNYADNTFISLKVKHFISIDYDSNSDLVLWGAGKKGKNIAQLLIEKNISFKWVTNNPNKIGHNIYGKILEADFKISEIEKGQIIISIADKSAKEQITQLLQKVKKHEFYWFC